MGKVIERLRLWEAKEFIEWIVNDFASVWRKNAWLSVSDRGK